MEELPPASSVALAYAGPNSNSLAALLNLDRQLAFIVSSTTEPMLGQVRLAWWRDALRGPLSERPRGNALLDRLGDSWGEQASQFGGLVDGWEALLAADELGSDTIAAFAEGRASAWLAFARRVEPSSVEAEVTAAARRWALADLAANLSDERERSLVLDAASDIAASSAPLPKGLRPLTVLEGLAARAIKAGGTPLLADRRSALVALRLGILGR